MQIKNATYGGERPLFASHGLRMEHVTIQAGESALKEWLGHRSRRLPFRRQIPVLARRRVRRPELPLHRGRTRGAVVFAQPYDERHASQSPQDVPRDGRHPAGERTVAFCAGNALALPQRAAAQRAGRQGRLYLHARRKHPHRGLRATGQLFVPILPQRGDPQRRHQLEGRFLEHRGRDGLRLRDQRASTWAGTRSGCGWSTAKYRAPSLCVTPRISYWKTVRWPTTATWRSNTRHCRPP